MVFSDDIYDILNKNMMVKIEDILNVESNNKDKRISTQQQVYIRKFVLIYLIHIDEIVTRKLQVITGNNDDMKIGYDITVEKMLLKKLSVTEDDLRDMMYGISFVRKDDSCTKLRITTQGERLLPLIQKSLNLQFPLRSCFLVAQLYEDYVQLSVNEVVTESGEKRKDQESIIIQEKLIPTPNIYKSLCLNAWNNIIEDTSRIQLCDTHKGYNNSELLEIFSLANRAKFTSNLEEFISEKILKKNLTAQETDTTTTINISTSCDCRVCLTLNDITEISFRPVLQDIISLVSTSLINKQLFGEYRNIRYMFHLIRFNYNSQFQHILMKILNDETDYFLYEQRIEIARYTIPILSNQLWRPIREREPCSYKAFQEGVLYHVHSENYGFGFFSYNVKGYSFKNKISDSKSTSLDNKTVFPLFKKGSKINNSRTDRVFYLNSENYRDFSLNIKLYRLKMTYTLTLDKKVLLKDTLEKMNGPNVEGKAFRRRLNIPFIISVAYKGYLSSLSLVVRSGGDGIQESNCTVLAEPMTLARF
ncbi:hypothetical protein EDC94DRAFT_303382 [Helicostylum pulchrum]|nr:hypothetical protein EDC94DRAFT_303382 [Helicostylum pulchrum]